MHPTDPQPSVEQPANASVLLTVTWRAWRLLGRDCGPSCSTVLRLALVTGGPPIIERVDGRPMGVISERCREAIEQALHELREGVRRHRSTSRFVRGAKPATESSIVAPPGDSTTAGNAAAAAPALEPRTPAGEPVAEQPRRPASAPGRPPTGIFRCDKQAITDRIERLKREVRPIEVPPEVPEAKSKTTSDSGLAAQPDTRVDPKTDAIARIAALRAQHAVRRSEDGAVTPFDTVPAEPDTTGPPEKRSSSVFRCEREIITDRITKLKRKPEPEPPKPPPGGEDETWKDDPR